MYMYIIVHYVYNRKPGRRHERQRPDLQPGLRCYYCDCYYYVLLLLLVVVVIVVVVAVVVLVLAVAALLLLHYYCHCLHC